MGPGPGAGENNGERAGIVGFDSNVFIEYYTRYVFSSASLIQNESQIYTLYVDEATVRYMKQNQHKLPAKWLIPLLIIIIGSSTILVANAFLRHLYETGNRITASVSNSANASTPGIRSTNNTPTAGSNAFTVQSHLGSPTAGHSPNGTPTNNPNLTPTTPIPDNGATLPPGSALPGDSTCASRVIMSSFEPRPDNYATNHRVPSATQISNLHPWNPLIGMDSKSDSLRKRVTGNFTGTTEEILQWVACKWGIDPNIIRAQAVSESYWHQSQLGDYTTNQSLCPPATWNGSSCYQSYGILQIKYTYFQSEWPMSRDDTAFNADFVYGWLRNCYEGWADYLYHRTPAPGYPSYHAGDIWGCLGFWFSGSWYDQGAINYINVTKGHYAQKPWLQPGF